MTRQCRVLAGDCRGLLATLERSSFQTIVTSPPYGDLKDYGSAGQIGYGHKGLTEYTEDLQDVLKELYRVAKDGSAMWVIIDGWRSGGTYIDMPGMFVSIAQEIGWQLQDVLVWDKGKSLPWTHHGRFRNVSESILLMSRGGLSKFYPSAAREMDELSPYWVRYPERYHPLGKAPPDLWHFPIPTQGSWTSSGKRHFCPFPLEMVGRMLSLTSDAGDWVLDPFAGTGTVPAVASFMERNGVGVELNEGFVRNFNDRWYDDMELEWKRRRSDEGNHRMEEILIKLKAQKYPKSLFLGLCRPDSIGERARQGVVLMVLEFKKNKASTYLKSMRYGVGTIRVVIDRKEDRTRYVEEVSRLVNQPPLSKFGLSMVVKVHDVYSRALRSTLASKRRWYIYTDGCFNAYSGVFKPERETLSQVVSGECSKKKVPLLLSNIDLRVAKQEI